LIIKRLKIFKNKSQLTTNKDLNKPGFCSLIVYKSQRYIFLMMCFIWMTISGIYYSLNVNIKNLKGNIYVNGCLIYACEVIGYLSGGFLMNIKCLGRIYSSMIYLIICFFVFITLIIGNFDDYNEAIGNFVARFSISGIYTIIYTYSTEVYPSPLRTMGFGTNNFCGRLGIMAFLLIIELLGNKIYYFFLVLCLICIKLFFYLPETYDKPMINYIPEEKEP